LPRRKSSTEGGNSQGFPKAEPRAVFASIGRKKIKRASAAASKGGKELKENKVECYVGRGLKKRIASKNLG